MTDGYVVNWPMVIVSKSPKDGVVGPLPNGLNGLYMGITNYVLTGMILQLTHPPTQKSLHALPSDVFVCFKRPFQGRIEFHLGDQKFTWKKLAEGVVFLLR